MGKGADLARAASAIAEALQRYVEATERGQVHVFESSPGHLRAVVGSVKFRKMDVTERQKQIWKYLNENVDAKHLASLWGVHPLDDDEYHEEHSPQSSSSSAYTAVDEEEETED